MNLGAEVWMIHRFVRAKILIQGKSQQMDVLPTLFSPNIFLITSKYIIVVDVYPYLE